MGNVTDLNQLVDQLGALREKPETDEERVARINRENEAHKAQITASQEKAKHQRALEYIAAGAAILLCGACAYVSLKGEPAASVETANDILLALGGALGGYAFKSGTGTKSED